MSKPAQTIIKWAYVNFVAMEFGHVFHLAITSVQQKDGIHSQTYRRTHTHTHAITH